jgi:hypothetical protein
MIIVFLGSDCRGAVATSVRVKRVPSGPCWRAHLNPSTEGGATVRLMRILMRAKLSVREQQSECLVREIKVVDGS